MYGEDEQSVATAAFEGLSVVSLRGEWDVAVRDRLRGALQAVGTQSDVLVDLREASFFDSSVLAELVALYHNRYERTTHFATAA